MRLIPSGWGTSDCIRLTFTSDASSNARVDVDLQGVAVVQRLTGLTGTVRTAAASRLRIEATLGLNDSLGGLQIRRCCTSAPVAGKYRSVVAGGYAAESTPILRGIAETSWATQTEQRAE